MRAYISTPSNSRKCIKYWVIACSSIKYLTIIIFYFSISVDRHDDDEHVLSKAIKKCTKSFGKCTVEQTVTLRAWSEKNDLPVDKFRKQVEMELEDNEEDWSS